MNIHNLKNSNIESISSNVFNDFLNGDLSSFNSYMNYFNANSDNPNIHFLKQNFLYNFSFNLSQEVNNKNHFHDISNIESSYLLKSIFVTDWLDNFQSNYSNHSFINFFSSTNLSDDSLNILLHESSKLKNIFDYLNLDKSSINKISEKFNLNYVNHKDSKFDVFKKIVFIFAKSQLSDFTTQENANSSLEILFNPFTLDKSKEHVFSFLKKQDIDKQISKKLEFITNLSIDFKKVIFLLSNQYSKDIICKSLIYNLKLNKEHSHQVMSFLSSLEYSDLLLHSNNNKLNKKPLKI